MKHQVLFSLKNNEKILMNVVCCSRDWRFKGQNLLIKMVFSSAATLFTPLYGRTLFYNYFLPLTCIAHSFDIYTLSVVAHRKLLSQTVVHIQYSHREIPISPARLGDTFCCLGDFLSFHRDNRYSQRDIQVTQRDVVTVHRA